MAMRRSGAALLLRSARICAESTGAHPGSACLLSVQLRNAPEPAQQSVRGADQSCTSAWSRGFRTGCISLESIQAVVPSMGDSITEGTIAGIAKGPSDAVAEDETIAQIETDKVTIDVRAPKAGVIVDILVKDEENVIVGQVIANIETGGASAPAAAKNEKKSKKAPAGAPAAAEKSQTAAAPATSPEEQQPQGYVARISFPPRRTADGARISDMPVAEAQRVLAELTAAASGGGQTAPQQETAPRAAPSPIVASPPAAGAAARRPIVSAGWGDLPPRRTLTAREMEIIELGGADP